MKRIHMSILGVLLAISLSGCITRTYTVMKERPDQEITGNQGYIFGSPPARERFGPKLRETYVIEVEMPYTEKEKTIKKEPKETEKAAPVGKGAVPFRKQEIKFKEEPKPSPPGKAEVTQEPGQEVVVVEPQGPSEELPTTYVVKKGDTLEKIAGRDDIYGDRTKWIEIYKANRDELISPDRIYPGQVLEIPRN